MNIKRQIEELKTKNELLRLQIENAELEQKFEKKSDKDKQVKPSETDLLKKIEQMMNKKEK